MKTSQPLSTISFNTRAFLVGKLNELLAAKIIEFWAAMEHQPEPDENHDDTKKAHFHVYLEPAKQVQTVDLKNAFLEPDPTNDKPRGCLNFSKSKFDDWYLYALHDAAYLMSKGQTRTWTYAPEEMITSDADDLEYKVRNIDTHHIGVYVKMVQYQNANLNFADFLVGEMVSPHEIIPLERAWHLLTLHNVYRNGHAIHPSDYTDVSTDSVDQIADTSTELTAHDNILPFRPRHL